MNPRMGAAASWWLLCLQCNNCPRPQGVCLAMGAGSVWGASVLGIGQ
jgi:hypothetical protein